MEYGILGALTVSREGRELRLGGAKQRSVLAVLLLRANELVPTARIVDDLWGERPPPTAVKAVQVQVSKLRKLLDEGALETRPTGYLLRVEPGALDLERFESLLDQGRERLAEGEARVAGELLREALGLWRGSPLAEFEYEAFARNEIGRLEELRLAALELRLEADLALGRHSEVVGELEGLVRDHPLRESFSRLLILALYRAGRQADALVAYQQARTRLLDELGLDPSQALQQLEKQILLQDPALDVPDPAQVPAAPAAQMPAPAVAPDRRRPEAPAARKVVSLVCCHLAAYDPPGGLLDPEALQLVMSRCFERSAVVVERHGGIIENASDRELMAVFGVPAVHEDDALRAVRAAVEIRDTLPELSVQARIGVTTGEVIAGDPGSGSNVVTGDPVALGKGLEHAAAPGEVLIGEATLALVGNAAEVEPVGPLELPGRGEPVAAYRVLVVGEGPQRAHGMPFVGRERELAVLREAWARVKVDERCELVTVVGEGGVGKSRLTAELLASIEDRVVYGRCLPYGDGITYWPVVEVLQQLDAMPSDDVAAAALRSLLGDSDFPMSADETAWAFRKLLEEQAPLVVCFDDLQWGEQTFLDLVESTGLLSAGAPLLLLCMARPELLGRRPSWPAPLRLEPLPPDEADELIGHSLPEDVRRRIADRAGGNPLFITEMLALATAGGELEVPPTLRALLAARLDQLEPQERSVLGRGAVEGEVFHRGAVQALAPDEPEVLPRLAALVRHGLIRPERPQLQGEDAFRFRHLLLRDAAYEALPKAVRSDLHRRFADWLEDRTAVVELDELVGYHLEQAARYDVELGRPDPALALRAGDRLLAAGVRALSRDDDRAAAGLLERGLSLTQPLRFDVYAELDFAQAVWHDSERAAQIADQTALRAGEVGDEAGEALARAMAAFFRVMTAPSSDAADELETLLLDARGRLEQAEDHVGLMYVWSALGYGVASMRGRYDDHATAGEHALHHSRLAGRPAPPGHSLGVPLVEGSRPADEALAVVDRLLAETGSSWLMLARAWLLAMLDRSEEAWQFALEADARLRDQNTSRWGEWFLAELSTLAGDHEDASKRLLIVCDWLEAVDDRSHLATYLPLLGRSLCMLGRFDEAEQLAKRGRALDDDDPMTQVYVCQVLARVHVHRGELAEAERLAREAIAESERTDSLNMQAEALCDLGEVLAATGRPGDAAAVLEQALDRCGRKKNLALGRQVGERLVELRAETQPA